MLSSRGHLWHPFPLPLPLPLSLPLLLPSLLFASPAVLIEVEAVGILEPPPFWEDTCLLCPSPYSTGDATALPFPLSPRRLFATIVRSRGCLLLGFVASIHNDRGRLLTLTLPLGNFP